MRFLTSFIGILELVALGRGGGEGGLVSIEDRGILEGRILGDGGADSW